MSVPEKTLYRVDEVAALCSVHSCTVRRWIVAGHLTATVLPNGRLRVSREALAAVLDASTGPPALRFL